MARVTKKIIYNDEESYTSPDGAQMFGKGEDKSASSSPLIQAQLLLGKIKEAAGTATNYLRFTPLGGLDVGFLKTKARVNIKGDGVRVYDEEGGESTRTDKDGFKVIREDEVISEFGETVTIGSKETGKKNVHIEDDSFQFRQGETILCKMTPFTGANGMNIGNDYDHFYISRDTAGRIGGYINAATTKVAHFDLISRGVNSSSPEFILQGCNFASEGTNYLGTTYLGSAYSDYAYHFSGEKGIYSDDQQKYLCRNFIVDNADTTALGNNSYGTRVYGSTCWANAQWEFPSDMRLKDKTADLTDEDDEILLNLDTFRHTWKDKRDERTHVGISAQQLQEEMDKHHKDGIVNKSEGYLGVAYTELIPMLIHLCQSQQKQIDELKSKL